MTILPYYPEKQKKGKSIPLPLIKTNNPPENDLGIVHDWIFSEFGLFQVS